MVNRIARGGVLRNDRRCVRTITIVLGLLVSRASVAGPSEAERVYEEGKKLADKQDYKAACQRFDKSFELDHDAGIEVRLADCHEHLGHAARAWHLFIDASQRWKRAGDARAGFARERASNLESKLAVIELGIPEPDLAGLEITVNGEPVTAAATVREAVPPGSIEVVASAPHHARYSRSAEVRAGEALVVEVKLAPEVTQRRRSRVYVAIGLGAAAVISGGVG